MSYTPTSWSAGNVPTASDANHWESQYAAVFDTTAKAPTADWFWSSAKAFGWSDAYFTRTAANAVKLWNGTTPGLLGVGSLLPIATTYASLPASPTAGQEAYITDCNTNNVGVTAGGSGSYKAIVRYNGTGWMVQFVVGSGNAYFSIGGAGGNNLDAVSFGTGATGLTFGNIAGLLGTGANGQIKFKYDSTHGVVLDSATDGVLKIFQRDGTTAGTLTAGTLNDSVGSLATVRSGGLSVASQAAGDILVASSSTQYSRLAKGSALQYLRVNSGATSLEYASIGVDRLYAASGTNTSGSAANLDTFTLPTLDAKDKILIVWSLEAVTQNSVGPVQIYSVTDSLNMGSLISASQAPVSGTGYSGRAWMLPSKVDPKGIAVMSSNVRFSTGATENFSSGLQTMTTSILSAPQIAFRYGGIIAGGTAHWAWSIYLYRGA
jgi:hypothetical protein